MNDYEVGKLLKWAYTTFGLVLHDHQIKSLILRFETYLKEQELDAARCLLELEMGESDIRQDMVDLLTIQESYFFRDQSLFVFLKHHFLPMLIMKKRAINHKNIRIWSAGCSKGEELYSLAILLVELIPDIQSWDVKLLGTDINHKALHQAQTACYPKLALRTTDEIRKNQYFFEDSEGKGTFQLIPSIKKMASFCYGNLAEPSASLGFFDLIFCRNVFIYLDKEIIDKALSGFEARLKNEGVLFLGPSDFVHYQNHNFFLHVEHGVTYYDQLNLHSSTRIVENKSQKKSHEKRALLSHAERQKQRMATIQEVSSLLESKQFEQALDKVNGLIKLFNSNSLLYRYKGEALIGLGDLVTAKDALGIAIQKDAMDAKTYFLLALVLMADDSKKAEVALSKAIYLKQTFVEAHYHLAMLYLGQDLVQQGMKHLKKAKAAAKQQSKDTNVMGYDGSIGDLLDVIEGELTHYLGC